MSVDLKQAEIEVESNLSDRYWRLNNLYWIMDEQGRKIKFKVNRVQYLLYSSMWWLNIILKSRQHGITTFICIFFLDACLFNNDVRAGIIAHRLDDAKRIFRDKIKYAYDKFADEWPELASGCKPTKEDAMEILFDNNSGIYVGTSMRSGTLQYLHISEYGWVCAHAPQKAKEIKSGALETIHEDGIVFIEATAEGYGTDFQAMCKDAEALKLSKKEPNKMEYKFHFFAWYDKTENVTDAEPAKYEHLNAYFDTLERIYGVTITPEQRTWYALKKKVLGPAIYKEHPSTPDEAFYSALEGAFFGLEMTNARERGQVRFVPYDPAAKVFTFWDGGNIYTAIGFFQFQGDEIRVIDCIYDELGQGLPYFAAQLFQERQYVYGGHYIGPDADPKTGSNSKSFQTGRTIIQQASDLGIKFEVIGRHRVNDRIEETRSLIPRMMFDEKKAEMVFTGLAQYRRRKNEQLSTDDRPVFFEDAVHDWTSHIADMVGHMALKYRTMQIQGHRVGEVVQSISKVGDPFTKSRNILKRGLRRTA